MTDYDKKENGIQEVFLMTVLSDFEMDMVEGILRYEGIPFLKKYPGIGGISEAYQGFFNAEIEIYVSGEDLQRARDAIQKSSEATAENDENEIE